MIIRMVFRKFKLTKNSERPKITALIDYEAFCSSKEKDSFAITKDELIALEKENINLIDIREPYEHEEFNIGGENIPMDEFNEENIKPNMKTILYCATGIRSKALARKLHKSTQNADVWYLDCSLKEFI